MPVSMGVGMKRKQEHRAEQKRQDVRLSHSFKTKRVLVLGSNLFSDFFI